MCYFSRGEGNNQEEEGGEMNKTGEEFYVHVTCRRDITYAFDVRNRLEMVCESIKVNPYFGGDILFTCVGDYEQARNIIIRMGGRPGKMGVVDEKGEREVKCLKIVF